MSDFGKRLRQLREEKHLTMKEVAKRIGVSLSTYREWEYGRSILGEPYPKMAEALGVGLGELFTGETPQKARLYAEIESIERHLGNLRRELSSFA